MFVASSTPLRRKLLAGGDRLTMERKIMMYRYSAVAIFAGLWMMLAACAGAHTETPPTEVDGPIVSEGHDQPDREFSDEEIERFAAAYLEVTAIQQDYQHRMDGAGDAEREQLNAESSQKAEEAMADHGLTPNEYNAIAIRLPEDDQLRAQVQAAVRDIEQQRIEETEQQLENQ